MTDLPTTVWVVSAQGVGPAGVCHVASSQAKAEYFAKNYRPDGDGYHTWSILPVVLDEIITDDWQPNSYFVSVIPGEGTQIHWETELGSPPKLPIIPV